MIVTARRYQQEVIDASINQNIIAFLPTGINSLNVPYNVIFFLGAGKTYVSAALIRHFIDQGLHEKIIAFVAPTKLLLDQQSRYIKENCGITSVKSYCGDSSSSKFQNRSFWQQEKQKITVMFFVPEVLRTILEKCFLLAVDFALIVLDECHHVLGHSCASPMCVLCELINRPFELSIPDYSNELLEDPECLLNEADDLDNDKTLLVHEDLHMGIGDGVLQFAANDSVINSSMPLLLPEKTGLINITFSPATGEAVSTKMRGRTQPAQVNWQTGWVRPRILGLTASPVAVNVINGIEELEHKTGCKLMFPRDHVAEIRDVIHPPTLKFLHYNNSSKSTTIIDKGKSSVKMDIFGFNNWRLLFDYFSGDDAICRDFMFRKQSMDLIMHAFLRLRCAEILLDIENAAAQHEICVEKVLENGASIHLSAIEIIDAICRKQQEYSDTCGM